MSDIIPKETIFDTWDTPDPNDPLSLFDNPGSVTPDPSVRGFPTNWAPDEQLFANMIFGGMDNYKASGYDFNNFDASAFRWDDPQWDQYLTGDPRHSGSLASLRGYLGDTMFDDETRTRMANAWMFSGAPYVHTGTNTPSYMGDELPGGTNRAYWVGEDFDDTDRYAYNNQYTPGNLWVDSPLENVFTNHFYKSYDLKGNHGINFSKNDQLSENVDARTEGTPHHKLYGYAPNPYKIGNLSDDRYAYLWGNSMDYTSDHASDFNAELGHGIYENQPTLVKNLMNNRVLGDLGQTDPNDPYSIELMKKAIDMSFEEYGSPRGWRSHFLNNTEPPQFDPNSQILRNPEFDHKYEKNIDPNANTDFQGYGSSPWVLRDEGGVMLNNPQDHKDNISYADSSQTATWNFNDVAGDGYTDDTLAEREGIAPQLIDYVKTNYTDYYDMHGEEFAEDFKVGLSRYDYPMAEEQRAHEYFDAGLEGYMYGQHGEHGEDRSLTISDFSNMSEREQSFILQGLFGAAGINDYTAEMYKDEYGTDFTGSIDDFRNWRNAISGYYNDEYAGQQWIDRGRDADMPYNTVTGGMNTNKTWDADMQYPLTHYPTITYDQNGNMIWENNTFPAP